MSAGSYIRAFILKTQAEFPNLNVYKRKISKVENFLPANEWKIYIYDVTKEGKNLGSRFHHRHITAQIVLKHRFPSR